MSNRINVMNPGWGDGKFEAGTVVDSSHWVSSQANIINTLDTTERHSGFGSIRSSRINTTGLARVISGPNGQPKLVTKLLYPGQVIKSSCWVKPTRANGATTSVILRHFNMSGNSEVSEVVASAATASPGQWLYVEFESVVPSSTDGFIWAVTTSNVQAGDYINVDDIQVWVETPAYSPSTAQILDLDGVRRRFDSFRYEVCDKELNPIGEIHPARGSQPSITVDTSNNTSRRLSGLRVLDDEMSDINVLSDRLRVYMTLQNGEEFRLGTFLWADHSRPLRSWGEDHQSELVDFSYILDCQSTRAYGWDRGAPQIGLAMLFLCFHAGFQLDDIAPIGKEADRGFTEPATWQPGSTWTAMLTDLCKIVGFAPPWFDRDGKLHLEPTPDPDTTQPSIPAYEAGTRVISDSITFSDDLLTAANDFGVFDSGTGSLKVGRWGVPSSAPHSFANRGFRVGKAETMQGLANQTQANQAARNMARTEGDAYEYVTFSSTLDPRHEAWEVIDAFGERWLETSFTMELKSGGKMEHKCKRVTYDVV